MRDYTVHEEDYKGFTIKIFTEDEPESPREWDNAGTMVCGHRRYSLGDVQLNNPEEFREWERKHKNDIMLPLYLYDHSGITINTTGFSCGWDSGQLGWIFITRKDAVKEWGKKYCTKEVAKRAIEYLKGEVKTYDDYLTGNVYGYVVLDDEEELDSCWGFYPSHDDRMGYESCLEEAKSMADWHANERDEKAWQGLPGIGLPIGAIA